MALLRLEKARSGMATAMSASSWCRPRSKAGDCGSPPLKALRFPRNRGNAPVLYVVVTASPLELALAPFACTPNV